MVIYYVKNLFCLSNAQGLSEKITNSYLRLRQEFDKMQEDEFIFWRVLDEHSHICFDSKDGRGAEKSKDG
ncbi:hypothetical protein P8843_07625 [Bacillus inaquosorum]|nr:hypothetical protein [Bacillus inaquosorum]